MTEEPKSKKKERYLVLARKYRPQTFDDIIGQDHIVQTLKNAIAQNRIHHFYLFTGSRGIGKTSTARVLAKAINCVDGPTVEPCGKCHVCTQIEEGKGAEILALYEIDGASNRGVDDIRELRKTIRQKVGVRYRVIIIDEVHMLTPEAFNALLKTLEEPPEHVKFIFATTEAHKVPETIISRCQRLDFRRISINEIATHLRQICELENIDAEDDALRLIARIAEGGMRDSQSKLDQAIAFSEGKIGAQAIEKIFGIISRNNLVDLIKAFQNKDFETVLLFAERVHSEGIDSAQLIRDLIDIYRELMIVKTTSVDTPILDISSDDREQLARIAEKHTLDSVMFATEILTEALKRLKLTEFPRLTIEIAFIKLCKTAELVSLERLVSYLEAGAIKPGQKFPAKELQFAKTEQPLTKTDDKEPITFEKQAVIRTSNADEKEISKETPIKDETPKTDEKTHADEVKQPEFAENEKLAEEESVKSEKKSTTGKKKRKSPTSSKTDRVKSSKNKIIQQFISNLDKYLGKKPQWLDAKMTIAWLSEFIISFENNAGMCVITIGDDTFIGSLKSEEGLNMLQEVIGNMFDKIDGIRIEVNKEAKIREKLRNNDIVRDLIKKFSASIISIKEKKLWQNEISEQAAEDLVE